MVRRIPAIRGHIDPATGCHFVVDDDDFLVMTAANGMGTIELELDLLVHCPFGNIHHCGATPNHFKRANIPFQQFDFEAGRAIREPKDEVTQALWWVALFPAAST